MKKYLTILIQFSAWFLKVLYFFIVGIPVFLIVATSVTILYSMKNLLNYVCGPVRRYIQLWKRV
jgi:hypothetical protein